LGHTVFACAIFSATEKSESHARETMPMNIHNNAVLNNVIVIDVQANTLCPKVHALPHDPHHPDLHGL